MKAMRVKKLLAEKKVKWSFVQTEVFPYGWRYRIELWTALFSLLHSGPQGDQETDLQEGWEVPQGVQADVQAWDTYGPYGSQSGKLLCASWAQTGLCHQDQRVSDAHCLGFLCIWLKRTAQLVVRCCAGSAGCWTSSHVAWEDVQQLSLIHYYVVFSCSVAC